MDRVYLVGGLALAGVLAAFVAVVWLLVTRGVLDLTGDRVPALSRRSLRADAGAAILLGLISGVLAASNVLTDNFWAPWIAAIWSFAMWIPLIWRRRAPVACVLAVAAIAALHVTSGYLLLVGDIAILIALYSVAAYGPRWAHRSALAYSFLGAVVLAVAMAHLNEGPDNPLDLSVLTFSAFALALAAWALGLMRSARFETVSALRERAAALEDRARQLEIERDQQAQLATQAERARIAREMHDIVAHSLSIMIVQADGGRYAAATSPQIAGEALETIASTGREALAEMRRLLGVLRSDDGGSAAELRPMGDAEGLQELFDQAAAAGMNITVTTTGEPRPLGSAAALTLHRACQEALTNVRKHAGPGVAVTVAVTWSDDEVVVEVADDGRGAASDVADAGFGLIGLRERAALVDGSISAGPRPGGGWVTRFAMPV